MGDSTIRLASTQNLSGGSMLRIVAFWGGLFILSLGVLKSRAGDVPSFPPHPRLATTAAELARLKQEPARKVQAVREAEALLKDPVTVSEGWGNWVFYYACPDDAS